MRLFAVFAIAVQLIGPFYVRSISGNSAVFPIFEWGLFAETRSIQKVFVAQYRFCDSGQIISQKLFRVAGNKFYSIQRIGSSLLTDPTCSTMECAHFLEQIHQLLMQCFDVEINYVTYDLSKSSLQDSVLNKKYIATLRYPR